MANSAKRSCWIDESVCRAHGAAYEMAKVE
jgi:hypothetical protein